MIHAERPAFAHRDGAPAAPSAAGHTPGPSWLGILLPWLLVVAGLGGGFALLNSGAFFGTTLASARDGALGWVALAWVAVLVLKGLRHG